MEAKGKTGLKYVVLVWPEDSPLEWQPFSNYRLACRYLGINYNSFNLWKKAFADSAIKLDGYIIQRKEILKEYACDFKQNIDHA